MSDPVADFLAREQNLFADFDGAPPAAAAAAEPGNKKLTDGEMK